MANENEQKDDEKDTAPDRSLATFIGRTRGQILRRAAGLTEDPSQSGVERSLLQAAQALQNAGDTLAPEVMPTK